jgi:hypothetical protein
MDFDQLKKEALVNSERLVELKEKINIGGDDPIWAYIFVLENYQRIYEEMPQKLGALAASEAKLIAAKTISQIEKGAASAARDAILERSELEKNLNLARGGLFFILVLTISIVLSGVFSGAVRVIEGSSFSLLKTLYFLPVGHVFVAGWATVGLVCSWRWFEGVRGARRDRVM